MKRFITFVLWIIIFLLLSFLVYQKYTGEVVDISYIANPVGEAGSFIKQKITILKNIAQWSSDWSELSKTKPQWPLLHTTQEFSGAKVDLQRNQDFSNNLIKNTFVLKPQVGKWDLFAARSGSADHTNDQIAITLNGQTVAYPAFYNANNALVIQQGSGSTGETYQATGIIILDGDKDYYFYYPVSSSNGKLIGIISSLWSGVISASESVVPFLFYRDSYLFTKRGENNINTTLYVFKNGMFTALATGEIAGVTIERDAAALHNKTTNEIVVLSLLDYSVQKTLKPQKIDINYQSFMLTGGHVWVKYRDNLSGSTVYEKQVR